VALSEVTFPLMTQTINYHLAPGSTSTSCGNDINTNRNWSMLHPGNAGYQGKNHPRGPFQ